jgi:hypothetical protein
MTILGVDPGLNGGLALRSANGLIIEPMPTFTMKSGKKTKTVLDTAALIRWLKAHAESIQLAVIETPGYRPGQSVQSGATVGTNFGILQGALLTLGIPVELVTPQTWMKAMHSGIPDADSKSRSLMAVSRLFPEIDFRESPKHKRIHDGMAEACLIAEYGFRKLSLI